MTVMKLDAYFDSYLGIDHKNNVKHVVEGIKVYRKSLTILCPNCSNL